MDTTNKILEKIIRWSAPYSPFTPLSIEQKWLEMEVFAQELSENDIFDLIILMFNLTDEDQKFNMNEFMYHFVKYHQESIKKIIVSQLKENGPWQIINLLGYTKDPQMFLILRDKVCYEKLNEDAKYSLIDALDNIKNKDSIKYLSLLKNLENNREVLDEIELVINNIHKHYQ